MKMNCEDFFALAYESLGLEKFSNSKGFAEPTLHLFFRQLRPVTFRSLFFV